MDNADLMGKLTQMALEASLRATQLPLTDKYRPAQRALDEAAKQLYRAVDCIKRAEKP